MVMIGFGIVVILNFIINMLIEFLQIVNDIKGNISSRRFNKPYFIKNDKLSLWNWFETKKESFHGYSDKDVLIMLKYGYEEPPKCTVCNKNALVQSYNKISTFLYCSKQCSFICPERRSKLSKSKLSKTEEEKKSINDKRENTMLEKYGVSYNSQREDVKLILTEKLSKAQLDESSRDKLLDKDWLYKEYVINNRSGVGIADELDVYYGTVLDYCRMYGFKIQKNYTDSLPQKQIYNFIKENYSGEVLYNDWSVLGNKELDIYIPELKLAIEHNGLPYHSSNIKSDKNKYRHINKTNLCGSLGVNLLYIRGDQWQLKQNIVKSIIKNKLGITENKVFARKCIISELDSTATKTFLNENHIQGHFDSSIRLGLFYNNVLVSVMTFSKSRYNKNVDWELVRFANKLDTIVVGGFSKLLKHFQQKHSGSIISYCDRSRGFGDVYLKNGFILQNTIVEPSYSWTNNHTVYNRLQFTRKSIKTKLKLFDESLTVDENMFNNKYRIIYDSGQLTFIKF